MKNVSSSELTRQFVCTVITGNQMMGDTGSSVLPGVLVALISLWCMVGSTDAQQPVLVPLSPLRGNLTFNSTGLDNTDLYWSIPAAPAGSIFTIRFQWIGVESAPQCVYDSIGITLSAPADPLAPTASEFLRFCGTAAADPATYIDSVGVSRSVSNTIRTSWNGAIFWFHSDDATTGSGFQLIYDVLAPMTTASTTSAKLIADTILSTNTSFNIPLFPSNYFQNPLKDGVLGVGVQFVQPNGVLTSTLPNWVQFQQTGGYALRTPYAPPPTYLDCYNITVNETIATPPFWALNITTVCPEPLNATVATVYPAAGNYTFSLTGTNSLNFSSSFLFSVVVYAVSPVYDATSVINCVFASPNWNCLFTPRVNSVQVFVYPRVQPIITSGGGAYLITTPAPTSSSPYQSSVAFTVYPPFSGGETWVQDSLFIVPKFVITAAVVSNDVTSTLACWPPYAPPASFITCEFTPRLSGVNTFSQYSLRTLNAPDGITGASLATTTGLKHTFQAQLGANSAAYQLLVDGSSAPPVVINAVRVPDNTTTLTCDKYIAVVNQTITCTLTPRNTASGSIVTAADYFNVSSVVSRDFNASIPFVVYNNANGTGPNDFSGGHPIIICQNITFPNITTVMQINTTLLPANHNYSLPYNYTYMAVNITGPSFNRTICNPLMDSFIQLQTDFPVDPTSLVSPLTPFLGTVFTFSVKVTANPGLRYLSIRSGNGTNRNSRDSRCRSNQFTAVSNCRSCSYTGDVHGCSSGERYGGKRYGRRIQSSHFNARCACITHDDCAVGSCPLPVVCIPIRRTTNSDGFKFRIPI